MISSEHALTLSLVLLFVSLLHLGCLGLAYWLRRPSLALFSYAAVAATAAAGGAYGLLPVNDAPMLALVMGAFIGVLGLLLTYRIIQRSSLDRDTPTHRN